MTGNRFPGGKRFAFTVIDDTDNGTVENLSPVYELLADLGFRTTKTVWPLDGQTQHGLSLEDQSYRQFVLGLNARGFEIALHSVKNEDATRDQVAQGLDQYRAIIGEDPRTHCNHDHNRDNIYWGPDRIRSRAIRWALHLATKGRYRDHFQGDREGSKYFWGDICLERIDYVRNLVFDEINLDRINPSMPYREATKPSVKWWFSACNGATADKFCHLLRAESQMRLEAEGGVCIVYTHFASGFVRDGSVVPEFRETITELAARNGWFVPVAQLLDHLRAERGGGEIPKRELRRMECRWLREKTRFGME